MKPIYLLDTCIISEQIKAQPHAQVLERMKRHDGHMAMSAISWQELHFGVERLARGRRQDNLRRWLLEVLAPHLPVLPYDEHAAWIHGSMAAELEKTGRVLSMADRLIAATAISCNLVLVTRNTQDFEGIPQLMLENWFTMAD